MRLDGSASTDGSGRAADAERPSRPIDRRLPAWSILVIALLVATVSAASIAALQRHAAERQEAHILLARIEGLAHRLIGLQYQAEAERQVSPDVARSVQDLRRQLAESLGRLSTLDPSGWPSRQVGLGLQRYEHELDALFGRLAAPGDAAAPAPGSGRSGADPAPLLAALADADEALGAEAQRASRAAALGSTWTLALSALAIGLLFWHHTRARRADEARLRTLVQNASDVIAIVRPGGLVRYVSPAAERLLGHAPSALKDRNALELVHPDDLVAARSLFARAAANPRTEAAAELRLRHADGSWRHFAVIASDLVADAGVGGIVATFHDVTERKSFEGTLTHRSLHDPLSGLPNRVLFMDRLEHALDRAERRNDRVAVLFLDLDHFKVINDSLGHQAGDRLLIEVAERLRACVQPDDTVARLGGDEFAILLEDIGGVADAIAVAERIADDLRAPFALDSHEVFAAVSVGIALSTPGQDRPDGLLRDADLAMYRAKSNGRARYEVFDPSMGAQARDRLTLETDLRRALERGELRLHYQPVIFLETGRITEVEALIRWEHPKRGLVPPIEFIPLAEETGLILPIGRWVLEEACRQAKAWHRELPDDPPLVMSVNLSARQFQHPELADEIAHALHDTELDPATLKLEITESAMMRDAESTIRTLRRLKDLGIQIAIDDFGTGYSSLAYLKRFPIDTLKIDGSFVDRLGKDPADQAIVQTIITLAKTLKLHVTGEGIETHEQLDHLRALACDRGQGYYFARPLPRDEVTALLTAGSSTPDRPDSDADPSAPATRRATSSERPTLLDLPRPTTPPPLASRG